MLTPIKTWWLQFRWRQVSLELLISLCLACLVWLYTHNRTRNSIDHVHIPVQVQLAAHQRDLYSLDLSEQRSVLASFSGPLSRMRELRRKLQRGIIRATVTLSIPDDKKVDAMFTETVQVDDDALNAPPGIKVELAQETISVAVQRLTERTLPVRLDFTGEARVSQIKIEPASVLVRGPKAVLDQASFLPTKPYAIQVNGDAPPTADNKVRDQVSLVTELEGRPIQVNPGVVTFRCVAVPKQKFYELKDVPVHFLCPKDCPWKPRFGEEKEGRMALKLIGPVMDQTPPVVAFIDLTGGNLARGKNVEPLRVQLPKDFQLADPTPPRVTFYLEEFDRPAAAVNRN